YLWDEDLGRHLVRARQYDPTQARFNSADPLGFAGGDTNLYAYAGDDPVNAADPSGMETCQQHLQWLQSQMNELRWSINSWISQRGSYVSALQQKIREQVRLEQEASQLRRQSAWNWNILLQGRTPQERQEALQAF